ncbi:hypothetical protein WA026_002376 [Henosepilachna vigintioctopunctata]|uniref:Uncharacterized protein n=1 Tax=Henosepilachna vigintioctopunctata TaxID=420089 RepID=A0AAW1U0Y8_9CUCU
MGMNFYARLNRTVIDGTPCTRPKTSTGRDAPHGTKGVCVFGTCKISMKLPTNTVCFPSQIEEKQTVEHIDFSS